MSDYKTFYKLEDTLNIISLIEEHQIILGTMKASKYVSYFSGKIDTLENSFCLMLDVVEQAEFFQNKFFFLEVSMLYIVYYFFIIKSIVVVAVTVVIIILIQISFYSK